MSDEQVAYWQNVLANYFNVDRKCVRAWYSTPPCMRVWIKGEDVLEVATIDIPFDELTKYEQANR